MKQKELAELLNITEAAVSKLVKRGMPTDTLERAQRWRKRHLEPGRVKGSRYDPTKAEPAAPSPEPRSAASRNRSVPATVPLESVERWARNTDAALAENDQGRAAELLAHLRELLRALPDGARPRMPLRVWLALVDYVLSEAATVRHSQDLGAILSPEEFAQRVAPHVDSCLGAMWLDEACDRRGYAPSGLPAWLEEE